MFKLLLLCIRVCQHVQVFYYACLFLQSLWLAFKFYLWCPFSHSYVRVVNDCLNMQFLNSLQINKNVMAFPISFFKIDYWSVKNPITISQWLHRHENYMNIFVKSKHLTTLFLLVHEWPKYFFKNQIKESNVLRHGPFKWKQILKLIFDCLDEIATVFEIILSLLSVYS